MQATFLFLGLLALLGSIASPPRITHITSPSLPGRLTVICGGPWEEARPSLAAAILPDGPAGSPADNLPLLPTSGSREVKVVQQSHGVLTCLMPDGPFGVVAVWGHNSTGRGEPVLVNRPETDWVYPQFPIPGQAFRVLGRNLVGLELYPEWTKENRPVSYGGYVKSATRVVLRAADGTCREAAVEKASDYDVRCRVPADAPPGKHRLYVHNGHGGPHGWASPLEVEIRGPSPWPTTILDARKHGAVADGNADDAASIQAALDAAGKGGGGVVLLPRGTYLIGRTLRMPHAMRDYDFDPARRPAEGGDCTIVSGPGIGQVRRILDNDARSVQLDRPWSIAPTGESRVLLCQYELYHRLLIVDNIIGESGHGVMLWGNSYDTIVDGNRTARTVGMSVYGLTHYDPRCMDIGYFNQVLHNTCSAGRFREPRHASQTGRGWIGGMSINFGVTGWAGHNIIGLVIRGNLCEDDSRYLLTATQYQSGQPPHIVGAVLEDNRTAHSRTAVQIGPGVRAVLRNNRDEDVDTRHAGEGMNDCVVLEAAKP